MTVPATLSFCSNDEYKFTYGAVTAPRANPTTSSPIMIHIRDDEVGAWARGGAAVAAVPAAVAMTLARVLADSGNQCNAVRSPTHGVSGTMQEPRHLAGIQGREERYDSPIIINSTRVSGPSVRSACTTKRDSAAVKTQKWQFRNSDSPVHYTVHWTLPSAIAQRQKLGLGRLNLAKRSRCDTFRFLGAMGGGFVIRCEKSNVGENASVLQSVPHPLCKRYR